MTAPKLLPSQADLKLLLDYVPETGKLYWRERPESFFEDGGHTAKHSCAKWNARWAGTEAFTKLNLGYHEGHLLGRRAAAHRVIWKWMTGEDPINIDHIDGVRSNNVWSNLRNVTVGENHRNTARRKTNKTGRTGVSWNKRSNCWVMTLHLSFADFDEAVAAREAAERLFNFHPNHGREAATSIVKGTIQ